MTTLAAITIASWSFTAFFAWITGRSLVRGTVETKNGTYKRACQPVVYWINLTLLGVVVLGLLGTSMFVTMSLVY